MHEHHDHLTVRQSRVTSYYSEREVAEYCRLEVQVVRDLSDAGITDGVEIAGEERRYSDHDLLLLRRVRRLQQDLGVNLEGVEIIMRLTARVDALQREVAHYKNLAARAQSDASPDAGSNV